MIENKIMLSIFTQRLQLKEKHFNKLLNAYNRFLTSIGYDYLLKPVDSTWYDGVDSYQWYNRHNLNDDATLEKYGLVWMMFYDNDYHNVLNSNQDYVNDIHTIIEDLKNENQ